MEIARLRSIRDAGWLTVDVISRPKLLPYERLQVERKERADHLSDLHEPAAKDIELVPDDRRAEANLYDRENKNASKEMSGAWSSHCAWLVARSLAHKCRRDRPRASSRASQQVPEIQQSSQA